MFTLARRARVSDEKQVKTEFKWITRTRLTPTRNGMNGKERETVGSQETSRPAVTTQMNHLRFRGEREVDCSWTVLPFCELETTVSYTEFGM